jgi:hypothetical protein
MVSRRTVFSACFVLCAAFARAEDVPTKHPWMPPIEPIYPTTTKPPSTHIEDGKWEYTDEYGSVRFKKGEKPELDKDGKLLVKPATAPPETSPSVAGPDLSSATYDANGQIDQLPLDSPYDKPSGKKEAFPPGGSMPWHEDDKTAGDFEATDRKGVAGAVKPAGTPESLGHLPAPPYHENAAATPETLPTPERLVPNVKVKNTGQAETLGRFQGLPPRDASVGSEEAELRARMAAEAAARAHGHGVREELPKFKPIPVRIEAPEADGDPIDVGFAQHSLPDLIALLKSNASPRFRARIADELGRRGEEAAKAVPALLDALDDKSALVKASAVLALGNIGGDAATLRLKLTPLLQDRNPDVKMSAQTALARLGK